MPELKSFYCFDVFPKADEEASHDQGMERPHLQKATTTIDQQNTPTMPMDAVMHVETSAKTSGKSVLIAFQVRTFNKPIGCQLIPLFVFHTFP